MTSKSLYEKSPVGQYITGLIQEIKATRKKLTKQEKDIDGVMSILGTLLELVDDTLRSFDNKKMPSKARFLWLFGKYTVIFSLTGGLAALKIDLNSLKKDHIIFLDFFKRSIDGLLKLLPDQIEALLPFINFQKIPSFVNEGFVVDKIKKFLVKKIPCYIQTIDHDEIEKIKSRTPAAYYCNYKSKKIFYVNTKIGECTEIKLTSEQWKKWDEFIKKVKPGFLTKSSLKKIQKITGHSHTKKLRFIVDQFSIDKQLKVDFQCSLTGNGLKLKKYEQSFNLNDFYQFFNLLIKYFKKFVKEEGDFLKGLVNFIQVSKNPDFFAGANYYLAFINAVIGDLVSENDVEKMLGISPDAKPASFLSEPVKEPSIGDELNNKIDDLRAIILGCREKMRQKEELSSQDLNTLRKLLDKKLSSTIKEYERSRPQQSTFQDEAFKTITEAETLRASIDTIQMTLLMLESLEEQFTNITTLKESEEKKQKQHELALFVAKPTEMFQVRYQLIQNQFNGDIFIGQTILKKMDAFKLKVCGEEKLQPELTQQPDNKSESDSKSELKVDTKSELESESESEEENENVAPVTSEQKEAENNSEPVLGYEDLKRIKIENLIEALSSYRYRIETNQDGNKNNFSYGFSFFTKPFKSIQQKSNYELSGILINKLQERQHVSMSGLFSKNNIKKLRPNKFNCGVNSKDLNYIFKSARNTKLKELVDLSRLEKAKDGTTYSPPRKK